MRNLLVSATTGVVLSLVAGANAAVVSNIDFSTSAQYTGNFVETLNAANIDYDSTTQSVKYNPVGANGASVIRYDTNPGNVVQNPNDFLTETLSVDAVYSTFSASANGSVGLYTRIQSNNLGILGIVNVPSTTSVQVRLFYGADTLTTSAGTAFYDATFNLANGTKTGSAGGTGSTNAVATNSSLTLQLTQTSAADPIFSVTLRDADGLVASSGNVTFTTNDTYNTAGSVGVRTSLAQIGNTIRIDNFSASAIPEPTSLTLLIPCAMLARRQRRA